MSELHAALDGDFDQDAFYEAFNGVQTLDEKMRAATVPQAQVGPGANLPEPAEERLIADPFEAERARADEAERNAAALREGARLLGEGMRALDEFDVEAVEQTADRLWRTSPEHMAELADRWTAVDPDGAMGWAQGVEAQAEADRVLRESEVRRAEAQAEAETREADIEAAEAALRARNPGLHEAGANLIAAGVSELHTLAQAAGMDDANDPAVLMEASRLAAQLDEENKLRSEFGTTTGADVGLWGFEVAPVKVDFADLWNDARRNARKTPLSESRAIRDAVTAKSPLQQAFAELRAEADKKIEAERRRRDPRPIPPY